MLLKIIFKRAFDVMIMTHLLEKQVTVLNFILCIPAGLMLLVFLKKRGENDDDDEE